MSFIKEVDMINDNTNEQKEYIQTDLIDEFINNDGDEVELITND